jgi:hypothetical protein
MEYDSLEREQLLAENQNNLVIATKRGDVKEIKRLQYKMLRMFASLAVRKVTSNRGKGSMVKNGFGQSRK